MTCRNFKDYTVWQEAMNLACKIYELIRKLPNEERFALCDQILQKAKEEEAIKSLFVF